MSTWLCWDASQDHHQATSPAMPKLDYSQATTQGGLGCPVANLPVLQGCLYYLRVTGDIPFWG